MRRPLTATLIAVVLTLTSLSLHAADITRGFARNTKIVARLDAENLRKQPLFIHAMDQKAGGLVNFTTQIRQWTGLDLDTVKAIWLTVEGEDRAAAILEGEFNADLIADAVYRIDTAQPVQREGVPFAVMLPDDKKPGQFNLAAILDDKTLIIGQPEVADAYIACFTGMEKGLGPDDLAKLGGLKQTDAMLHAVVLGFEEKEIRKNPWMRAITGGELMANLDKELAVNAYIGVANPDMVEPVCRTICGFRDLYATLDPEFRKLQPIQELLLAGLDAKPYEGDVLLTLLIDEETLNEFTDKFLGGR